jgi:hypothetical protein
VLEGGHVRIAVVALVQASRGPVASTHFATGTVISCNSPYPVGISVPVICAKPALARAGLVGCVLIVLAPSAFAQKVNVQYDHDADFSHIRRYKWRTHPVFEKNPELQQTYATGIQLVLEAGNAQLMKRGFEPDDVSPDIFVSFFLLAKDASQLKTTVESGWGGWGWYAAPAWAITEVEYYKEGMLVIDVVDAGTSKLLWRAYCGDQIKDMRNRDKNINSAVRKAFERFPPKSK